ncbi:unnamed protein product [Thlaspi arvense]|uniref:Uncharacterized protein n=1 Tax=Thlaspi arvense TaxID=13288 RepID=A0AAU9SQE7_THLAR|nr:unnamed protein product [Thlaspi arvense]
MTSIYHWVMDPRLLKDLVICAKFSRRYDPCLHVCTPYGRITYNMENWLRRFDAIVSADAFENLKPAPDIFLTASKILNVPTSECIVIEDALAGVQAAKAAQMRCIAVTTTLSEDALKKAGPSLIRQEIGNVSLDDILTGASGSHRDDYITIILLKIICLGCDEKKQAQFVNCSAQAPSTLLKDQAETSLLPDTNSSKDVAFSVGGLDLRAIIWTGMVLAEYYLVSLQPWVMDKPEWK